MIRPAKRSDKDEILSFCTNTFSWGDYIDQVWDMWRQEGKLFVAESEGKKIAMAHAALCPGKRQVWLEGIRVHPDYRRSKVATALMERMLRYGSKQGARQACAIVAEDNTASQRMMEKNGFAVASQWVYYSTDDNNISSPQSSARLATARDIGGVWSYLRRSEIYKQSAKTYVKAWRWYPLDRATVKRLIKERSIAVTGTPIDGVAVLNRSGYWKRTNVLQVVYLDSASKSSLRQLVSFAANLCMEGKLERLHVLCHKSLSPAVKTINIEESEQFLLYNKALFT